MNKRIIQGVSLLFVVMFLASCTMKTYVQDRDRVDQKIFGNAGCIQGTCPEPDRRDAQKTRKTFVLEIETKPKAGEEVFEQPSYFSEQQKIEVYKRSSDMRTPSQEAFRPIALPVLEPKEITYTDYKIQEGDTLQKISKKFYDTYQRWNQIYEVNKDILPNPDRIKPGTVIRIPNK